MWDYKFVLVTQLSSNDLEKASCNKITPEGEKGFLLSSILEPSLGLAERGRPGGSIMSGGEGAPPLTGEGPKDPSRLNGPATQ